MFTRSISNTVAIPPRCNNPRKYGRMDRRTVSGHTSNARQNHAENCGQRPQTKVVHPRLPSSKTMLTAFTGVHETLRRGMCGILCIVLTRIFFPQNRRPQIFFPNRLTPNIFLRTKSEFSYQHRHVFVRSSVQPPTRRTSERKPRRGPKSSGTCRRYPRKTKTTRGDVTQHHPKLSAMVSMVFQTPLHSSGNVAGAGCLRNLSVQRATRGAI